MTSKSLLVIFTLAAAPLQALDPHAKITDFIHTAWSGGELPFGAVTNIAQTKDGTLWVSGIEGVFRFDGVRFTRFEPLSRSYARKTLATRDGSLWVLFITGEVNRLFEGRINTFPSFRANAIAEDRDGSMIAATAGGIARFRDGHWSDSVRTPQIAGKTLLLGVWFARDGTLWLAMQRAFLRRSPGEDDFTDPGVDVRTRFLPNVFAQSPQGTVWLADSVSTQSVSSGGKASKVTVGGQTLAFDHQGSLWIGNDGEGLWRIPDPQAIAGRSIGPLAPQVEHFTKKDGLSGNRVWSALEDREGNFWVGTNEGLDRFRESPFHSISVAEPERINELTPLKGGALLLRMRELHYMQRVELDGKVTRLSFPGSPLQFRQEADHAICEDTDGTIWLGTSTGFARVTAGRISYPPQPRLTSIVEIGCGYGEVWVYDSVQGALRFSEGKATNLPAPRRSVARIFVESPGRAWMSHFNGSVSVYRDGAIQEYGPKEGVPRGAIKTIFKSADGDVWLAGEGGLARFRNGRFQSADVASGVPLYLLVAGDDNSFWLAAGESLVRMDIREFDRAVANPHYRPRLQHYGALEGVPGILSDVSRSGQRLWVSTTDAFGYLDTHGAKNPLAPPVQIETVIADGNAAAASEGMALPKLSHTLQIDYTAFSLTIPEKVQFRYKLEGVDKDWQEPGTRRQAYYNDLAPKKYRFRVTASNNDGVWNEAGASLDFSIDPAYYQTRWFQAALVAAFIAMLWGLYRYRLSQVAHEFNVRLEERVGERTRIARDLHDTLLQGFQGLMLRLQVVDDLLPEGKAKDQLEQSLQRADQAIAEGRSAVYDLRSSATIGADLAQAVKALGDELSTPESAAFRLVVEGPARDLNPIIRDELYRMTREALRNAFSHAQANHIEAEISWGEREFRLRIRDDGVGIPLEMLEQGRPGHYGLPGMRERSRQIGGKLDIWSGTGTGTEIEFSIAGSVAYRDSAGRSLFRRFWKKAG